MDWKVAFVCVLFALLALSLLVSTILLWLFFRRDAHRESPPGGWLAHKPPGEAADGGDASRDGASLLSSEGFPRPESHLSAYNLPYWEKLVRLMDEEEPWRDPKLTLNALAERMGTNRTRLAQVVQEAGYVNYKDFINRRRIRAFLALVETGQMDSILEAFYSVGYQSKMTALRHFKEYMGITPSEYLRQRKLRPAAPSPPSTQTNTPS